MSRHEIELEDATQLSSVHLLPNEDAGGSSSSAASNARAGREDQERLITHASSSSSPPLNNSGGVGSPSGSGGNLRSRTPNDKIRGCFACLCLVLFVIFVIAVIIVPLKRDSSSTTPSQYASLAECLAANRPPNLSAKQPTSTRPPIPTVVPPPVLFQHANIWRGDAPLLTDADLLIQNGKVTAISDASGQRLSPPSDPTLITYDATNRWITPGIIDLHSHAGLGAWPEDLWATDDINEMTAPTFPQLRAVDALDPRDMAFPLILNGGVTTSQLMPGSGDAMGGEGVLVKNRGRTVQDMILQGGPRLMKMACGENVKRVYGKDKGVTPMSRLGSAWVMRERFEKALALKQAQDDWCNNPGGADYQSTNRFPNQREHESLAALLRGEVVLNTHCYLTQDFEMMLRLSTEFGFKITTFHHALSAWRIADVLAWNQISVATFSDLGLYKYEAYDASTTGPKVLYDAGVNVILKSDHPVTFSGWLSYEAGKAHHYGLPAQAAIAAITSAPAKAAGIDDHLGKLLPNYDADLVVWDRDPLVLGAKASLVFVDGVRLVDLKDSPAIRPDSNTINPDMTESGPTQTCGWYNNSYILENDIYKFFDLPCYSIVGVTIYTPTPLAGLGTMTVVNGNITCLGAACVLPTNPSCQVYRIQTGTLIPGLIEAGTHVGLFDIGSEDATGDGSYSGDGTSNDYSVVSTLDGIRFQSRHVRSVWSSGITTVVTRPRMSQLVQGLSAAFRTCCGTSLEGEDDDDPVIVADHLGLHLTIGNPSKSGGHSSTISNQLALVRTSFEQAAQTLATRNASSPPLLETDPMTPWIRVLQLELPLIVEVNQADEILAVVRVQKLYNFRLVLLGGAEAHLVAPALAKTTPPVSVLYFSRPLPSSSETLRTSPAALAILQNNTIPYAISTGDTDNARNLRWEAGWNLETSGLTMEQAVTAVTSSVAAMFNLPAGTGQLIVGRRAEFVLFNGSPFSLQTTVQLVGTGDQVDCRPKQR